MNLYLDQFSSEHDFPEVSVSKKVLIIASTPRSGSHLLGHSLYTVKKFGFPLEYLQANNQKKWREILGTASTNETLSGIMRRRTSPTGVFGIKLHFEHLSTIGGIQHIPEIFPNPYFVLISRSNVLQQAISYAIAEQTGVWIEGQTPVKKKPVYQFDKIDYIFRKILHQNASWRYSLLANQFNFIEIDFDFAKHHIRQEIVRIAEFLNIEISADEIPTKPITSRQEDPLKVLWETRYLEDYQRSKPSFQFRETSILTEIKAIIINKLQKQLKK